MNYQLKLAKVVETRLLVGDASYNLFRVRVLPDMSEIPETQNNLLPLFPNFFKQNNTSYQMDDIVWTVCDELFQIGFILGLSQPPSGTPILPFIEKINAAEKAAGQPFTISKQGDLSIINISGSAITFSNPVNAQAGQIFNNNIVYLFGSDGTIWVRNPGMTMKTTGSGDVFITGKNKVEQVADVTLTAHDVKETVKKKKLSTEGMYDVNVGGSYTMTTNNVSETILGTEDHIVIKKQTETIGAGVTKTIVAGGETETVLLGNYNLSVVAGTMNLTTAAGTINLTAGAAMTLTAPVFNVVAAAVKFPSVTAPVPSLGPFCSLPVCLFSGVPHTMPGYVGGP